MTRYERISPDILTPGTLYTFLYCLLASGLLTGQPIIGGALYLLARVFMLLLPLTSASFRARMSRGLRLMTYAAVTLALVFSMVLLAAIPRGDQTGAVWPLAGIVALSMLRASLAQSVIAAVNRRGGNKARAALWLGLIALASSALIAWMTSLSDGMWSLAGGFALASALEIYTVLRAPEDDAANAAQQDEPEPERAALRNANAYRAYERMRALILCALQVSLAMIYTTLGAARGNIIACMGVVLFFTTLASEAARAFAKRAARRQSDPVYVILVGMLLWGAGMLLFALRPMDALLSYAYMALTTCGLALCARIADSLRGDMRAVCQFVTGAPPDARERVMQQVRAAMASVMGQLISLASLLCIMLLNGQTDARQLFSGGISPFLLAPALLLVFCAALSALKFPLTRAWLRKLRNWLALSAQGFENQPLEDQLSSVVIRKHHRHTGIRVLIALARPLYYHRILCADRVPKDGDAPIIFLCNHGELYGPIVANLYIPFSFRPWVISEMAAPEQVTDYIHTAMVNLKLIPRCLQTPMAKLCTPIVLWIMRSIECIPVYRTTPRALIKTMRDTVTAMEAGDNILLFPEHAGSDAKEAVYRREGVGEFHTGFVTLGDMYSTRTGKNVCYMPMYASKRKRTLTFGHPVYHDSTASVVMEKTRICKAVRDEMLAIYEREQKEEQSKEATP